MKRENLIFRYSAFAVSVVLFTLFLFVGCKKGYLSGLVPVTGTVLLNGVPVEGANLSFEPLAEQSRCGYAITDNEGNFVLSTLKPKDGVYPGDYTITVSKVVLTGKMLSEEEAEAYMRKHGDAYSPPSKNMLPAKYSNKNDSDVKITVEKKGLRGHKIMLTGP